MKLSLYIPAKPYIITQAWGIYNPAYQQFGFTKHNGIDFAVDKDGIVKAMCDGTVIKVGFVKNGAGNFVIYRTGPVEAEGETCLVDFYYMHAEKQLVKEGDKVKAGDPLIIADNTGFSTGPHTHISSYRWSLDGKTRLDNNEASNTFDFSKYYNGKFADDIGLTDKFKFTKDLEYGMTGSDVFKLQTRLVDDGHATFTPTGFFGSKTFDAVKAFQAEHGLPQAGRVGPLTRGVLNSL